MRLTGWGRFPERVAELSSPTSAEALRGWLSQGEGVVRGMGRAYGDSALSSRVAITRYLDRFHTFDEQNGLLRCDAGVTLRDLLAVTVPRGWTLSVTPGTSWVTVGGAIASDVHGKNHHRAGTFGRHVESLVLLTGDGEIRSVSRDRDGELFLATCGGMGLTGAVLSAELRLSPLASADIVESRVRASTWEASCELFHQYAEEPYSVSWVDVLSSGRQFGRSIFSYGRHASEGRRQFQTRPTLRVPTLMPTWLLNDAALGLFNRLYYAISQPRSNAIIPTSGFFYPLDSIADWNRLYGSTGFVQYQFVVPLDRGVAAMKNIISYLRSQGHCAYLAVLKLFGDPSEAPLSFPLRGFSIALDFRYSPQLLCSLKIADQMVVDAGGRVYLAKDSSLEREPFRAMYPRWSEFAQVRRRVGSEGVFVSDQAKRLGFV